MGHVRLEVSDTYIDTETHEWSVHKSSGTRYTELRKGLQDIGERVTTIDVALLIKLMLKLD